MTAERTRPIDLFKAEAQARCPGFLYSFNIADLKRRNCHLGLAAGDRDIAELDLALKTLASPMTVVVRLSGQRWLLFSTQDEAARIQGLLGSYKRKEKIWTGWHIDGERPGERAYREWQLEAEISRAIRCIRAVVKIADALEMVMAEIEKNDFNLPLNEIVRLEDISGMARTPWCCVSRYPERSPACPFCGSEEFAWEDGDMSVYSGYGSCKRCRATIDIRQVEHLTPPAHA